MTQAAAPVRPDAQTAPELTLPPQEAAALRAGYEAAEVILEYGTGGSTLMAAQLPGRAVFGVDSDPDWIAGLEAWFGANPSEARVVLHHGDIGPVARWGYPAGSQSWRRFQRYPLGVWDRDDFRHPDVVLIDGRFRAACYLTVLFRITRPVTVYWDDYTDRPGYREVERLSAPVALHGRMAEFRAEPTPVPPEALDWVIGTYARPN
ncbi:class I SAM-dependent methyltransferase [Pseudoroseicyclus aestuarii]|uniref:Methyltransferase family protein n=1 Tax=Pseudoroseicyclus aestuarii TaxID=1795041 RepID=A0A318SN54_9RHOB|nr:class I SAM-dependent methyltransferase [Pseudoroseicyclus aestuarii]PYE81292.1 hypothetical protein DFP88_10782 [Pseudoroseicyclus aestuarii]